MLIFEQSTYDIFYNMLKGNFETSIKCINGKRTEHSLNTKIETGKNLFKNSDIRLDFSKDYFNNIKKKLLEIDKTLLKNNISFSAYITLHNEKVLINKTKNDDRSYGFVRLIFSDEKRNIHMNDIDIIEKDPCNLSHMINKSFENYKSIQKLINKSKKIKKMQFKTPVILSPEAAGYLTHEIIGHILESDFYSFFKEKYQNLKCPKNLIIKDDPNICSNICGIKNYDDLGNKIYPLTLIENGKLNNILSLNKKESFDNKLYGVARRENFKSNVLPRMRATFIVPSNNYNIEKKYTTSVFMNKPYLGGVNPQTGDYSITGSGFYIKNGEKQSFIRNLKIYGNILNDISKIEYIGDKLIMYGAFCKKLEQNLRVGLGGPTISIYEVKSEGELYE